MCDAIVALAASACGEVGLIHGGKEHALHVCDVSWHRWRECVGHFSLGRFAEMKLCTQLCHVAAACAILVGVVSKAEDRFGK